METTRNTTPGAQYRIRIMHDSTIQNPFKDWDTNFPLMYEGEVSDDFSNGEIDDYLTKLLSYNQILENRDKLVKMIDDDDLNYDIEQAEPDEDISDMISDALTTFLMESIENRVTFCEEFNIKHYSRASVGYSQGDYADILIVPTPENAKKLGYNLEDVTVKQMEEQAKLFDYWAWGDVYGFIIEKECACCSNWEHVDSIFGFFGRDPEENGMLEYIDPEQYGWTRNELKTLIEDAEVEYN